MSIHWTKNKRKTSITNTGDKMNNTDTITVEVLPMVIPTQPKTEDYSFSFSDDNDAPNLEFLVDQINKLQMVIKSNELISKTNGKRALGLAIQSGKLLLDCKKELHCKSKRAGWVEWVGKNITSIKYQTVTRYIELYQYDLTHENELEECESIREAYYKVGIFKRKVDVELPTPKPPKVEPEPEQEEGEDPEPEPILEIPFETVRRLTGELKNVFENNQCDGENYTSMVNLLEPLVKIYNDHQPSVVVT